MLPVVRRFEPVPTLVVRVHRQVAEEIVPLPQTQLASKQAALPTGVDDVPGRQRFIAAPHRDCGLRVVEFDGRSGAPFPHFYA